LISLLKIIVIGKGVEKGGQGSKIFINQRVPVFETCD
jgi:hypothetical protein